MDTASAFIQVNKHAKKSTFLTGVHCEIQAHNRPDDIVDIIIFIHFALIAHIHSMYLHEIEGKHVIIFLFR